MGNLFLARIILLLRNLLLLKINLNTFALVSAQLLHYAQPISELVAYLCQLGSHMAKTLKGFTESTSSCRWATEIVRRHFSESVSRGCNYKQTTVWHVCWSWQWNSTLAKSCKCRSTVAAICLSVCLAVIKYIKL